MQFFGVGILELVVILTLAVLVIGPDRVPAFAADLAKWIRQARAYANHMMKDFNEVVTEVQKEAGSSAEDWKEIASVFNRHTGDVMREVTKAGSVAEAAMPNDSLLSGGAATSAANGSMATPPSFASNGTNGHGSIGGANGSGSATGIAGYGSNPPYPYESAPASIETQSPALGDSGEAPKEELAWYVPERRHRRRSLD